MFFLFAGVPVVSEPWLATRFARVGSDRQGYRRENVRATSHRPPRRTGEPGGKVASM